MQRLTEIHYLHLLFLVIVSSSSVYLTWLTIDTVKQVGNLAGPRGEIARPMDLYSGYFYVDQSLIEWLTGLPSVHWIRPSTPSTSSSAIGEDGY